MNRNVSLCAGIDGGNKIHTGISNNQPWGDKGESYVIQTTISHGRIWGKFLCCLYICCFVAVATLLFYCHMHILAPLLVQRFAATVGPN